MELVFEIIKFFALLGFAFIGLQFFIGCLAMTIELIIYAYEEVVDKIEDMKNERN